MRTGPSECVETRVSREKDLKRIWHIIVSCEEFMNMYLVIGPDIDLFREAPSCY